MGNSEPAFSFLPKVNALDRSLEAALWREMDNKTKPLGSLGKLEDLAVRLSLIQGTSQPKLGNKLVLTFAADHGLSEEGVSAYPKEVSAQMVANFAAGGAAINVICRELGIGLYVVDMGVDAEFVYSEAGSSEASPGVIGKKVRRSTRNCAKTEAMTAMELGQAIKGGMEAFYEAHTKKPVDMLGLGEMGIGNSSSAVLLTASVCGLGLDSLNELVGRGAGLDDRGLERKRQVLRRVYELHKLDSATAMEAMQRVGGYEIAGMSGAAIAAAALGIPVMLDGLISTAAGLCAWALEPKIRDYLFIGHKSAEKAQACAVNSLGLEPVLDMGMRLGEGTGAALAMKLADVACSIMRDMASFDKASVSRSSMA